MIHATKPVFSKTKAGFYDFVLEPLFGAADLRVAYAQTTPFRPGFLSNLFFTAHNDAAPVPNAALKVWLPDFLQVQSISVPPDQIINDTLCWQIGTMDFNASFVVSILVRTAPAIGIGTPVPVSAYAPPVSGDLTPANNFF